MLTAGATRTRTRMGRWLGAATAALTLLLLLGGLLAVPAGANSRDQNVIDANDFVTWCLANGGTPDVDRAPGLGNIIRAHCDFTDGSSLYCNFWSDGHAECLAVSRTGDFRPVKSPVGGGTAPPLQRPPSGPGQPGGPVQTGGTPLPKPGAVQTGGTPVTVAARAGGHGKGMADHQHGGHRPEKGHHGQHGHVSQGGKP